MKRNSQKCKKKVFPYILLNFPYVFFLYFPFKKLLFYIVMYLPFLHLSLFLHIRDQFFSVGGFTVVEILHLMV